MTYTGKIATAVAVGLVASAGAQANVIYNWQSLQNSDDIHINSGKLVVTDAAAQSGSIDASNMVQFGTGPDDSAGFPDSPIVQASLDITAYSFTRDIAAYPHEGREPHNASFYDLEADLNTVGDGLTGRLYLTTNENTFQISATDPGVWSLDTLLSDLYPPLGCDSGPDPEGRPACEVSGRWIRASDQTGDPASAVPSPGVWSLFGLAALGALGIRRRRSPTGA